MKKETLKSGSVNLDSELDFSGDDFNFDYEEGGLDKKRTPASPVKDGAKEAISQHFASDANLRRYITKSVPEEFGDVFDSYTNVRDATQSAIEDVKKATLKPTHDFAKLIKQKIGDKHKRSNKVLDWLIDKTEEYKSKPIDQRKVDEDAINLGLGSLEETMRQTLAAQTEQNKNQRAEDQERDNLKQTTDALSAAKQNQLLDAIARSNDVLAKTATGFNVAAEKKSLELRFRMVFGIRDLVAGQREMMEMQRAHLKAIQHNTGLPEAQKLRLDERFHNTIKNKFVDGALGSFGKEGFAGKFTKNISRRAKETAEDVGEAIRMGHMGVDMMSGDDFDFDDNATPEQRQRKKMSKMATSMVMSLMGPKLVGKASAKIREKFPGLDDRIQKGAARAGYFHDNMDSIAKDFAYGGTSDEGFLKQGLRGVVGMGLPSRDNDKKLNISSGDDLLMPGTGNNATSRSLIEVIPGLLARILQEAQIARTGNTKQGLSYFDWKTGLFRTNTDMKAEITNQIKKNTSSDMVLDTLMRSMEESGAGLSLADKTALKKALMSSRMGGKTMTAERLMKPEFFDGLKDTAQRERLAGAFSTHFKSENGKFNDTKENLVKRQELFRQIEGAVRYANDPRAVLQQAVAEGHIELLREMGWVNEKNEINLERAYTYGIGDDTPGQDTSVWRAAQGGKGGRGRRGGRGGGNQPKPQPQAPSGYGQGIGSPYQGFTPNYKHATSATGSYSAFQGGQAPKNKEPDFIPLQAVLQSMEKIANSHTPLLTQIEENTAKPHYVGVPGMPGEEGGPEGTGGGFWDRSVREHAMRGRNAAAKGARAAKQWWDAPSPALSWLKDKAASMSAFGSRKFEEFKDNLPSLADVYVKGIETVKISKDKLKSGTLRDSAGKVIASIKDLAESVGDIKDETGEVVMAEADKLRSYLKANGEIFMQVWWDRIKRGAKKAMDYTMGIGKRLQGVRDRVSEKLGIIGDTAMAFAKEMLVPPQDVYVRGEQEPRLHAYLMRRSAYFDKKSGKVIDRPTLIRGPVVDADNNELISQEDLQKGIVDVLGKPFKTLVEQAARKLQQNVFKTQQMIGKGIGFLKQGFGRAVDGVKTAGRLGSSFLKNGMAGVRSGLWKQNPDKMAQAAAEDQGVANGMVVSLLSEIRDILRHGVGGGGSASSLGGMVGGLFGGAAPKAPAEGPATPQTNSLTATPLDIGGIISGAGGMAGKGWKALKGMGRRLLGRGKDLAGNVKTRLDESQPEISKKLDDLKAQGAKKKQSIKDYYTERAQKMRDTMAARRAGGVVAPTAGDMNGDGVRDGSVLDKMRNAENKNDASNARGGDKEVPQFDTMNSVDYIAEKMGQAKGWFGDLFGGDDDDDIPDGKRRGRKGRGKAGKAGKLGRLARASGRGLMGAGRLAGRGLMGAGRLGVRALPFVARRVLPAAGAMVAGAIGAPVLATAATVAGVGLTGMWLWDTFKPKDKNANTSLATVRYSEYGFGMNDVRYYSKLAQLEQALMPALVGSDDKLSLDKSKVPASAVLDIFGIKEEEDQGIRNLLSWLEARFKPTFLKWMKLSKRSQKSLSELDQLTPTLKVQILEAVELENTGWNALESPFNGATLAMTATEVKKIIQAAKAVNQKNADKPANDPKQLTEDAMKTGAAGAALKATVDAAGNAAAPGQVGKSLGQMTKDAEKTAAFNTTFKTGGLEALPGQKLDAITSIKLRCYGLKEPTMGHLIAIKATERAVTGFISVDKNGVAQSNLDVEKVFEACGKYFGIARSNQAGFAQWRDWLTKRFMPVFTNLTANLVFHTGLKDAELAQRALTPVQAAATANQLVGTHGIWDATLSAWPGQPGLADSKECKPFTDHLDEKAKKANLQEITKSSSDQEKAAQGYAQQRYEGAVPDDVKKNLQAGMNKTVFRPDAPPDAESEPRGGGNAPSSKPLGNQSGIPLAMGERSSGNGADEFIKVKRGATLDGMHPEVMKLFRGMAEEYGSLTGNQIGINSGSRTYEQQAAEYNANPNKAARPGSSMHERGLALDIDSSTADELERLGLMRKYGFTRPVGGETWHIEPAGIQPDVGLARNDPNKAAEGIQNSPGKGGGGVGITKTAFALGRRSTETAIAAMNATPKTMEAAGNAVGAGSAYAAGVRNVQNNQVLPMPGGNVASGLRDPQMPEGGGGAYASMPKGGDVAANKALVEQAAKVVGVDPNIAMTTVAMESSFKSDATPGTTTAKGLNQFTSGTWSDMMKRHGKELGIPPDASPSDPRANALLGARFLKANMEFVQKRGLPTDVLNTYLPHFLGQSGSDQFNKLGDDDIPAQALPSLAAKNRPSFYDGNRPRTKAEMVKFLSGKLQKTANAYNIPIDDIVASGPAVSPSGQTPYSRAASAGEEQAARPRYASQSSAQSLGYARQVRDDGKVDTVQNFDKLVTAIAAGNDVQTKQLTALDAIRVAVQAMDLKMAQILQTPPAAGTTPAPEAAAPVRPSPGTSVRKVPGPILQT